MPQWISTLSEFYWKAASAISAHARAIDIMQESHSIREMYIWTWRGRKGCRKGRDKGVGLKRECGISQVGYHIRRKPCWQWDHHWRCGEEELQPEKIYTRAHIGYCRQCHRRWTTPVFPNPRFFGGSRLLKAAARLARWAYLLWGRYI